MNHYDAIILGAGQSGMPLARQISKKGFKVALIEQEQIGGTCINDNCSPTKTMVASAKVAHMVGRAGDFGVEVPAFTVNQKKVKKRKQHIVELFRGGAQTSLDKAENIEIIKGKGTFDTDKVIRVTDKNG